MSSEQPITTGHVLDRLLVDLDTCIVHRAEQPRKGRQKRIAAALYLDKEHAKEIIHDFLDRRSVGLGG